MWALPGPAFIVRSSLEETREELLDARQPVSSSHGAHRLSSVGGFWLALTLLVTRVCSADDLDNAITPNGAALVALSLHAWTDFHELLLSLLLQRRREVPHSSYVRGHEKRHE